MEIYNKFMEWCESNERKKTFIEYWIKSNKIAFDGQKNVLDEYHSERAWDMMVLENEIKGLKAELKFLKEDFKQHKYNIEDNYIKKAK